MSMVLDLPVEAEERLDRYAGYTNRAKEALAADILVDQLAQWDSRGYVPASPARKPQSVLAAGIANGTIRAPKKSLAEPFVVAKVDPARAAAALAEFEARI